MGFLGSGNAAAFFKILIYKVHNFRSKGVDKIYKFDVRVTPIKTQKQFVYFISADLVVFKNVLNQISSLQYSNATEDLGFKEFHCIVVPNVFYTFKQLLEEEGLHDVVSLYRFSWDFIALDKNVLSLEIPQIYKDLFVKNDTKLLASIASSLRIFNMVHKRPNFIMTYGDYSEKILSMIDRMENFKRTTFKDESADFPDFSAMLIMDRNKDYPSCLMTPVVYSGLLLELFDFKSGFLTVSPDTNKIKSGKHDFLEVPSKNQPETTKKETISLRMGGHHDDIYDNNKYRHFADVVNLLSVQSKALGIEGSKYSRTMNLNEMKQYVEENLPKVAAQKKSLYKHLILCESVVQYLGGNFEKLQTIEEYMLTNSNKKQVMSYLEEQISTEPHKYTILRLYCLYHITNGLQPEECTKFITNYCNTFGHNFLHIFQSLFTAKLFPDTLSMNKQKISLNTLTSPLPKRTPFQIEMNKLKLIPSDPTAFSQNTDEDQQSIYASSTSLASSSASPSKPKKDATSPSYVFNGNFIPMVAQIANFLLKTENVVDINSKFSQLDMKVSGRLLPGPPKSVKDFVADVKKGEINFNKIFPLAPRTLFIFVVGGITYAEIAACNLVEALTGSKIVLASNQIICGEDLIKSVF